MWVEGSLNYAKQNRKMRRSAENLDNVPKKKQTNKQQLFHHSFHKVSLM